MFYGIYGIKNYGQIRCKHVNNFDTSWQPKLWYRIKPYCKPFFRLTVKPGASIADGSKIGWTICRTIQITMHHEILSMRFFYSQQRGSFSVSHRICSHFFLCCENPPSRVFKIHGLKKVWTFNLLILMLWNME